MAKKLKIPPQARAKVNLFGLQRGMDGNVDDLLSPPTSPEISFNFCFSDGALKSGLGVERFAIKNGFSEIVPELPNGVYASKVFFYKRYDADLAREDNRIIVLTPELEFYECNISVGSSTFSHIEGLSFSAVPTAVCYKYNGNDVIIFSAGGVLKVYDGNSVLTVTDVPEITSMCVHGERLFVTTGGEQTSLWFSDDFDPTQWYVSLDQAGFIDFQDGRGRLLKVVSFNNYVYVFRNYGITRLSAFGAQTEFSATGLFLGSGRIFQNSIVDCGNRIIYLAEDGFYSFDGVSSVRILSEYDKYLKGVDNRFAKGVFYNGKLFFTLALNVGETISCVLCYDVFQGMSFIAKDLYIYDMEIIRANEYSQMIGLCTFSHNLVQMNFNGAFFNQPLRKVWKSRFCDFGIPKHKTLQKITLYSPNDLTVNVKGEHSEKTFEVKGKNGVTEISVGVSGKLFSVEVESQTMQVDISKITLYFNYF